MSLIVKDTGGGDFELTPAGNHVARCYMVVDMGIQDTNFGKKHKIRIGFELSGELMQDGRPFGISKEYTASLSDKANLRHDLESWRGRKFTDEELKGFDVFNVAGHACMLNVIHAESGGKTYANISSISSMPKGMQAPELVNEIIKYSTAAHNDIAFRKVPEWLRNRINRKHDDLTPDFNDDVDF